MKQFFRENKNNPWFWAFFVLIVAMLFALPIMSLDSGNSGDEDTYQIPQGRNIVNYFKTNGEDSSAITFFNLRYYGSSPDVIAEYWNQAFKVENINQTRHIFNALYGWIAILFAGLLAYLIGGWRAGVITIVLLFLSPRFIGHSFNNTKDTPFAAGVMAAVYFMALFFKQFPKVKIYTFFFLILFIAFSISARIGGVLLYGYFGLFGLAYLILNYYTNWQKSSKLKMSKQKSSRQKNSRPKIQDLKIPRLFLYGLGIVITSYFLGLLLWPFALQSPINNSLEAFKEMSKFSISIRQVFEGSLYWSNLLPKYYTLKYIFMTVPIAVFVGLIPFFLFIWKDKKNYLYYFIVFFAFFFPVFWIYFSSAIVYHGWRHTLFTCAPMVVAAGLGFNALIEFLKNKYLKIAATALPFLLLIMPLTHIVKNHPYEYVYFNELAGGMDKAYGNYEMDYYYHSTRAAAEWVMANAQKTGLETGDKTIVSSWHPASVGYFLRNDTAKFQNEFIRWYERANHDWDYAIFVITGMPPEQIKCKHFPPQNVVHTITVDGKPICFILKRKDKSDWIGYKYKSENQIDSAVYYFKKSLEYDAYNEVVLLNLIETYFQIGMSDSAKIYIDRVLAFLPSDASANFYLVHYHLANNNLDDALIAAQKMIRSNNQNAQAYRLACEIYLRKNDIYSAEKELLRLMDADMNAFFQTKSNELLINIYKAQGLDERVAHRKMYKYLAESFRKQGNEELAEQYEAASRN